MARPRSLRTYVARLFAPDGTQLQTVLLRGFYNKEAAKRKLKLSLENHRLARREPTAVFQRDLVVLTGHASADRSLFLQDPLRECIANITDLNGSHIQTVVLEDFSDGHVAFQCLRSYLKDHCKLDPDALRIDLVEPLLINGPE